MKKVRANALWNELSVKQRKTLDKWLFEEGLSYIEAWERAKNELGFKGSKASVQRYYTRRKQERILTEFKDLRDDVAAVSGAPVDEKALRMASMKVLGQFLFQQVRESPENVKEWGMVASLIVDNDRNELLREIKGEELKMRQQAMAFAREKFQFDMVKRALKALPELLELAEAKKDPTMKEYEGAIRLNRAVCAMFGARRVHPESDQEAREMLAAKREREARQKAEQEAVAERRRIRDELGGAQPPLPSSRYYQEYLAEQAKPNPFDLENAIHKSEVKASAAAETEQAEREKLLRELRKLQAEREADEQDRERALREYQAQAAEISEVEQAKQKKLQEQREAERAERKQQREQRKAQAQARLEEMREVCGWQEVQRPPGTEEE